MKKTIQIIVLIILIVLVTQMLLSGILDWIALGIISFLATILIFPHLYFTDAPVQHHQNWFHQRQEGVSENDFTETTIVTETEVNHIAFFEESSETTDLNSNTEIMDNQDESSNNSSSSYDSSNSDDSSSSSSNDSSNSYDSSSSSSYDSSNSYDSSSYSSNDY